LICRSVRSRQRAATHERWNLQHGRGHGRGFTGEGSAPPVVIPSRVSTSDPVALVTTARAMVETGKVADLDAFAGAVQALVNAVQDAMAERDAMADMARTRGHGV
jgi:hypothetical protein